MLANMFMHIDTYSILSLYFIMTSISPNLTNLWATFIFYFANIADNTSRLAYIYI